ncbi:hypothetical protein RQP46_002584 [Phenoliferia psychrophenolica]
MQPHGKLRRLLQFVLFLRTPPIKQADLQIPSFPQCAARSAFGSTRFPKVLTNRAPGPTEDTISSAQSEIARLKKLVEILMERLESKPSSVQPYSTTNDPSKSDSTLQALLNPAPPAGDIVVRNPAVEDAEALLSFANSPTSPNVSPSNGIPPSPSSTSTHQHPSQSQNRQKLPTPTSASNGGHFPLRRFSQQHHAPSQDMYTPHYRHPYPPHHQQPAYYNPQHHAHHSPYGPYGPVPHFHPYAPSQPRPHLPPIHTAVGRAYLPPQIYYEGGSPARTSDQTRRGHEARYDEAVRAAKERKEADAKKGGVGVGVVGDAIEAVLAGGAPAPVPSPTLAKEGQEESRKAEESKSGDGEEEEEDQLEEEEAGMEIDGEAK